MTQPQFKQYRHTPTGDVLPALKFPAGYEDAHPNEYEGVEPEAKIEAETETETETEPTDPVEPGATQESTPIA